MGTPVRRRVAFTLGWVAGGVVFVALVTALFVAAVASARTGDAVDTLSRQLDAANHQLAALRADNDAQRQRSEQAARQRLRAMDQNRDLQRQLAALAEFLRAHGFDVAGLPASPTPAAPPPARSTTPPSAPASPAPHRPRHTAGPPPTRPPAPSTPPPPAPTPTPVDPLCGLGICLD